MAQLSLPGLFDIHVHLRDPGATHKEDFHTGLMAAASGGFTFVIDMPNNPGSPTISPDRLNDKISRSATVQYCKTGFHYGTDGNNLETFDAVMRSPSVFGLKVYLGETTGDLMISSDDTVRKIFEAWNCEKPILVHATGGRLSHAIDAANHTGRRIHICHIADSDDIGLLSDAKAAGLNITAGVTPHHLFLDRDSAKKLGPYGLIKPPLVDAVTQKLLWKRLLDGTIDIIESDHSPHTKTEKESATPYYGMPQLETTLGLLFSAVKEGMITSEHIVRWLHHEPKRIFNISDQPDTFITLDPDVPYIIGDGWYKTKCAWSPYEGMTAWGKVLTVVIGGSKVVDEGRII